MRNCWHYFINVAKIDFSNLSNVGEMTSERCPSQEENKSSNSDIYP